MIYQVIVDISNSEVDKVFDYSSDFDVPIGSRVLVPFGYRTIEGFVINIKEKTEIATKNIIKILDDFVPLNSEMLSLAKFLKTKNIRYVDSLRLCIPSKLRGNKVKEIKRAFITLIMPVEEAKSLIRKGSTAQFALLDRLVQGGEYESVLNGEYNPSSVKALLSKNIVERSFVKIDRIPYKDLTKIDKKVVLTEEQNNAVNTILSKNGTFLLHGVTGSGKTEIYMNVIKKMLDLGKTAIMLVPEISLTPQMLGVFRARFGDEVSILHSGLSDGQRFDEWLKLLRGQTKVALGARSAIFAPVKNVGVIIIDEEHDGSYVSESNPRYFTSEIAEFRAKYNDAKLILGSATPSLGVYQKAINKDITLIKLLSRANNKAMPDMEIIDMRKEVRGGNNSIFSKALLSELQKTINEGNQAMLFINRRGYSSFIRCRSCGYIPKCQHCDVSLTYHKDDNRLHCHYCGEKYYMLDECPECHNKKISEGKIGTEKVVEELNRLFPSVKVLRMDVDTTTTKDSYVEILGAFREKQAQILVGTQMIVKGHDFPDVTLVGVLDADLSLYFSDYRSNEHTFQLITQVAGRAGRADKKGSVIIQTYNPHHYVFKYSQNYDYEGFFDKESNVREATQFPPYSKIIRILVKSCEEKKAIEATHTYYNNIRQLNREEEGIFRVKAMRAPIKRINDEYRMQIIIWCKSQCADVVLPRIYKAVEKLEKGVVTFVEINPSQMS